MPYKSEQQRKWAHTDDAKRKGFPTKEFDTESKGIKLPKRKSSLSSEDKMFVKKLKGVH